RGRQMLLWPPHGWRRRLLGCCPCGTAVPLALLPYYLVLRENGACTFPGFQNFPRQSRFSSRLLVLACSFGLLTVLSAGFVMQSWHRVGATWGWPRRYPRHKATIKISPWWAAARSTGSVPSSVMPASAVGIFRPVRWLHRSVASSPRCCVLPTRSWHHPRPL